MKRLFLSGLNLRFLAQGHLDGVIQTSQASFGQRLISLLLPYLFGQLFHRPGKLSDLLRIIAEGVQALARFASREATGDINDVPTRLKRLLSS